jgi:hypothetical protein
MEQSSFCQANWFVVSQEIHCVLLNPKTRYRIHNYSPPVSILSQPNPVHTPTSHFLKIFQLILLHSSNSMAFDAERPKQLIHYRQVTE